MIEGKFRWAYLDLNQGLLPYQGSALTGLSYRPDAAAEAGYLSVRRQPKLGQSSSARVTSRPPSRFADRL